ncbi:hypothetical protein AHF37_09069 [Paragonimus kellicotti]|nr:hypothetical protein AHF37_09069 [Paragonimus kellicotti]
MPPPLNTIVSPKSVYRALCGMYDLLLKCAHRCSFQRQVRPGPQRDYLQPAGGTSVPEWDHIDHKPSAGMKHSTWLGTTMQRSMTDEESAVTDGSTINRKCGGDLRRTRKQTYYQKVMCRLVRRYIHQSKKTMRQDGVNEDDLLEIKQDISSLRYELREDRKREVARTIGHLEGLKRDLVEEIAKQMASLKPFIPTRDGLDKLNLNKSQVAQETIPPIRQRVPMDIIETPTSDVNQTKVDLARQQPKIATEVPTASADTDPSKMFSIAYGRETQYMYDEIKQLALVNNAFEGASGTIQQQRTLPVCTYLQLKQDILQGVREELKNSFGSKQAECDPAQSYSQSKSNPTRSMSTVDRNYIFC